MRIVLKIMRIVLNLMRMISGSDAHDFQARCASLSGGLETLAPEGAF
jgi:hypothetical protein